MRFAAGGHARAWPRVVRCRWWRLRNGNVDMLVVVEKEGNIREVGGIASAKGSWG